MGGLPSGVVTFCFTDIEGSTRLARRHPEEWPAALELHHATLRAVWERCAGVEVKTEGDAFFVAFADAGDAMRAVVEAQEALTGVVWPFDGDVRVRIGLHTGEAVVADEDYVGAEVHLAARVAAAAHGRQVLVSGQTAEVVGARLPVGVGLKAIGSFALKDFEDGVELFSLSWPGADVERAPRAMPVAAHNVPLVRSSFLGRDVERVEVAKLVSDHRLVTVLGSGGAGKTRLALEVARMLANDLAHGAWVVLLAGLPAGADITDSVARTLGIADVAGTEVQDALANALADREQLLVLDNCEHVVDSASRLVDHLLARAPGLHVLTTSRQALAVRDERVWSLPTMDVPPPGAVTREAVLDTEAGQLFAERAAAANPSFVLTDETAPAVSAICRHVEGLPLAIELAAATSRVIPLETLAERVAAGSRVLRSGNRHDDPRQQTIDELIRWSYDLLDELQRAVFRRLAVFRGGCTIEAAEAVVVGGAVMIDDVLPTLGDLADRSLLILDGDRYRMLVLVRGFAEQCLEDEGERETILAAHAAWAVTEAGVGRGLDPAMLRRAEPELDNYSEALATLLAEGSGLAAYDLLFGLLGNFLLHRGHYGHFERLLADLQPLLADDPSHFTSVLSNRAQLALLQGRRDAGLALAGEAAALARRHDLPERLAAVLALRGGERRKQGDLASALADFTEALELDVSPLRRATLIEGKGFVLGAMGEGEAALAALLEAAAIYEAEHELLRAVAARLEAAERMATAGDVAAATRAVEDALRTGEESGVPRLAAHAHYVRARLARHGYLSGRAVADAAWLRDLDDALELAAPLGEPWALGAYGVERAVARHAAGDLAGARRDLREALPLVVSNDVQPVVGNGLVVAALLLVDDDPEVAATLAGAAVAMTGVAAPEPDLARVAEALADGGDAASHSWAAALAIAVERLGAGAARS